MEGLDVKDVQQTESSEAPKREYQKRSKYFIKKGFQTRLTLIIIFLVIIVANVTGGLVYGLFSNSLDENADIAVAQLASMKKIFLPGILLSASVSMLLVAIICLFVTHTIAGPVYRLETEAKRVSDGDLSIVVKLRPKDELQDLAGEFNSMVDGIKNIVDKLKSHNENLSISAKKLEDVRDEKDIKESVSKLKEDILELKSIASDVVFLEEE